MSLEQDFVRYSVEKLRQYLSRIEDCLSRLTPEQVWLRNAESENSVGNLVLHLTGNVTQWIGFGVAGLPDNRHRDAEFAARGGVSSSELIDALRQAVDNAVAVVGVLSAADLAQVTTVQKYTLTKLEAIYHVIEHFSGHTGQILFATKLFTGQDLGYYQYLSKSGSVSPQGSYIP